MNTKAALLIIDLQNDFCPGGALPVPHGNLVVEPLNRLAARCAAAGIPVLASRDWHPAETSHFSVFGGVWPVHCIQGSPGAAFHPDLRLPERTRIISKGCTADADAYSAFEGADADGTPFREVLEALGVGQLYVGGLATDYCVRSTVLDALKAGCEVFVLTDAIAGVDVTPGDSQRALEEMKNAGARLCASGEVEV